MKDYVLFHMWEQTRRMLIARHHFYVEQARSRVLSQFVDIELEADKVAERWLERASQRFDPDRDDEASIYESARDEGIAHYQLLADMRENIRLSVVAGMFHEWDKQLREWLVGEILHWHHGDEVRSKIWAQDFVGLCAFLASLGWDVSNKHYYSMLNACRLVVNVYKHGDGASFQDLRQRFPQYIANPLSGFTDAVLATSYTDYTDLRVSDEQLREFSDAIVYFWNDVPEHIFDGETREMPKWFEKALNKDIAEAERASDRAKPL